MTAHGGTAGGTARSTGGVAVEVPASCANLGPGFDAFAVAVDLRLVAEATGRTDCRVLPEGEGAGEVPTGDDNLLWRALVASCDWFGAAVPDVSVRVRSAIPLERGLGSSAAAAVAGAALARALTGAGGRDEDLVDLVAALEGHADNAAAAVLGGLVAVVDGVPRRLRPSAALRPVLCVPAARSSTAAARRLLPASVPLRDAAANGARAALVLAGLAGLVPWEPAVMRDALHEPPRLAAMAGSGALVAALRDAGIGACLSGAGPSVLAVVRAAAGGDATAEAAEAADVDGDIADVARVRTVVGDVADDGWRVVPAAWDVHGATARHRAPSPPLRPPYAAAPGTPPGRRW